MLVPPAVGRLIFFDVLCSAKFSEGQRVANSYNIAAGISQQKMLMQFVTNFVAFRHIATRFS